MDQTFDCDCAEPLTLCLLSSAEAPADVKPEQAPAQPAAAPVEEPAPAQAEGEFTSTTHSLLSFSC